MRIIVLLGTQPLNDYERVSLPCANLLLKMLINLKKILIYASLGLLVLQGIMNYSGKKLNDELIELTNQAQHLTHKADSLKKARNLLSDSVDIAESKIQEKYLLTDAVDRYLTADQKLRNQLDVLNLLEVIGYILFGLTILGLIILIAKKH